MGSGLEGPWPPWEGGAFERLEASGQTSLGQSIFQKDSSGQHESIVLS